MCIYMYMCVYLRLLYQSGFLAMNNRTKLASSRKNILQDL